ncbi:MAG: hypothetical protein WKG07_44690 [Hymenobacter sp.]
MPDLPAKETAPSRPPTLTGTAAAMLSDYLAIEEKTKARVVVENEHLGGAGALLGRVAL